MTAMAQPKVAQHLLDKILSLPADRVAEVEDFVDFLSVRAAERVLSRAAAATSERAFAKVWDNPDDAVYDLL
jgi:hypothetical protein